MINRLRQVFDKLDQFVIKERFSGLDPYDGLNSRLLRATPFYRSQLVRLIWIQCFKRFSVDLRGPALVPKGFNPKAGALFLSANLRMFQSTKEGEFKEESIKLFSLLKDRMLSRKEGAAWGYNFDWQAKAFFVPQGTPNIVTSVYVGQALLDYYEILGDVEARTLALKIKDFILSEMVMWEKPESLCFSYIPEEKAEVHNANLLAAAYLSRVYGLTREERLKEMALKAVRFSTGDVGEDGYWPYGTMPHHRWMDNFHTGFNLEALLMVRKYLGIDEWDDLIKRVYRYYIDHFFEKGNIPRYYSNKTHPIDIHNIAESIILFSKVSADESRLFGEIEKKEALERRGLIMDCAIENFWDKKGYFHYQKGRFLTNKIPYMRWSQAWMYYAMSWVLS